MGAENPKNRKKVLLVVEDDLDIQNILRLSLRDKMDEIITHGDALQAIDFLDKGIHPQAILLDLMLPKMSGLDFLELAREHYPELKIIVISARGDVETVVKAMQLGAYDYIHKPFDLDRVSATVEKAVSTFEASPERAIQAPHAGTGRESLGGEGWKGQPIFESKEMAHIMDTVKKVALTDIPLLITGESGVGKEIIAREIHRRSRLSSGPFLKVNCAALPASLLESEIFGYEKGAFTGAVRTKLSKFEGADNGTLLLDEIGELEPGIQAKFLQVLQDGSFNRLGNNKLITSKARILVSTNRNLEEAVADGNFRSDLFYRLNVVRIHIPPLRDRPADIPVLANHFLEIYNRMYNRNIRFDKRQMELIIQHPWPGNVRELQNVIKRYSVLEHFGLEDKPQVEAIAQRPSAILPDSHATEEDVRKIHDIKPLSLKEISKEAIRIAEKEAIRRIMEKTNRNKSKAARELRISYKALLYKIKEYSL